MAEYEILIQMALAGGRESFVTDAGMYTLWTNSDRRLSEIMMIADKAKLRGSCDREVMVTLDSGELLRKVPVRPAANSAVKYFLFEIFKSSDIISAASQTEEFREYARSFAGIRSQLLDFAREAAVRNGDVRETDLHKLISGLSNRTAVLNIMSSQNPAPCLDVTICLTRLASKLERLYRNGKNCTLTADIEKGLQARVDGSGLTYAVTNLVSNAFNKCGSAEKKVTLTASASAAGADKSVVISVEDNGDFADGKAKKRSRKTSDTGERKLDRSGLAVAQVFAEHHGGDLILNSSKTGIMTAQITVPFCGDKCGVSVHSPEDPDADDQIINDIVMENFDSQLSDMYIYSDSYYDLLR